MILIISKNTATINYLLEWLVYLKIKFIKIDPDSQNIQFESSVISSSTKEYKVKVGEVVFSLSDIKSILIWHGDLFFKNLDVQLNGNLSEAQRKIAFNIGEHNRILVEYFVEFLKQNKCKVIGDLYNQNTNKLCALMYASSLGIAVPISHISTSKRILKSVLKEMPAITKSYYESPSIVIENEEYGALTAEIDFDIIPKEEEIFPTLIQEKIEKLFEIRSYYLHGKFYSMAIFSQQNSKTEMDYRNYSIDKPNRTVPFKLPIDLEEKLTLLMYKINQNHGSFDLIYTNYHEIVFLEVNPVGQFGMVSVPCNYHLTKNLAYELSS